MDQQTETPQQDDLDVEFRKILCIIRQHIPFINSNAYLLQCRIWLEKLSTSNEDKVARNLYLAELCKQMQANKLLPPFNEAPPKGKLKKLPQFFDEAQFAQNYLSKEICALDPSKQEKPISDNDTSFRHKVESWETAELFTTDEELIEAPKTISKLCKTVAQNKVVKKRTDMCCGEPALNQSETELIANELPSKPIDDDSWSDLSDLSGSSGLNEQLARRQVEKVALESVRLMPNNIAEKNIPRDDEFVNLRSTLMEPSLKFLKDTSYLSQDWKKTIAALQLRLSEMIQQNNELNNIIQKLEIQLEENKLKTKAQNEHNLTVSENKHSQEIAKLKEAHSKTVLHVEKSLADEYEQKLKEASHIFEEQMSGIKAEYEGVLQKKDCEIGRLSEIIQSQCLRIMNELSTIKNQVSNCTCDKKIHVLKKCVSKMDKVFQRSEKEYLKQIDQLRQELELKDSALQVQLKIQKAELIAQTRTGQKEEFEEILNALEVKYIKMLEAHEKQIMKIKAQDDATIQHLSDLLVKHGISYHEKQ